MRVNFGLVKAPVLRSVNFQGKRDVIALIDYDGTYEDPKHPEAKTTLEKGLAKLRKQYAKKDINFMPSIVTARPKVRLMQKNPTPEVQWSITQNGGEIVNGLPTPDKKDYPQWVALNESTGFKAKKVQDTVFEIARKPEFSSFKVLTMGEVVQNPAASECEYMQPFCIKLDEIKLDTDESKEILEDKSYKTPKQIKNLVNQVEESLKKQGVQFEITEPYLFKGKPFLIFDVASPFANKAKATEFLIKQLDIEPKNVIVAGDGGNDISMMVDDGRNLVIVGENKSLRQNASMLLNDNVIIRPSGEPSSIGVLEGLKSHLDEIAKRIGKLRK